MSEVNRELGTLVREYRLKMNMTQLDLARKLGYDSTQFVSLFERGLSRIPLNVLGKLIIILGVPEKKVLKTLLSSYENEMRSQINDGKRSVSGGSSRSL